MKNNRKASSVLEFIIIVAIIIILIIAVLLGYKKFFSKDQLATDNSVLTQMNKAIKEHKEAGNELFTVTDAGKVVAEEGFDISRLKASAEGYRYGYNLKDAEFVLIDANFNVVNKNYDAEGLLNTFAFVQNQADLSLVMSKAANMSIYLQRAAFSTNDVTFITGLDEGEAYVSGEVNYNGGIKAKDVMFYTNSGTLNINAPLDTVTHYGRAYVVNLTCVAKHSYIEGGIVELIAVQEGRVVLTEVSDVSNIHFVATDELQDGEYQEGVKDTFAEIIIDAKAVSEVPTCSRDVVEIPTYTTNDVNAIEKLKVCVVEQAEANETIYLTKQGIEEQIVVEVEVKETEELSERNYLDLITQAHDDTKEIAKDLANNYKGARNGETGLIEDVVSQLGEDGQITVKFDYDTHEFVIDTDAGKTKETDTVKLEEALNNVINGVEETGIEKEELKDEILTQISVKADVKVNNGTYSSDLYFNDQVASSAVMDIAYTFYAFDEADRELVYAFFNAKDDSGKNIFRTHIEDYSDQERINAALNVITKSYYGDAGAERIKEILRTKNEYFDWLCDFEVTFSSDIKVGSIALAGFYSQFAENFNEGEWLGFGVSDFDASNDPIVLEANKTIRLLDTMYDVNGNPDFHMNYAAICGYVREFSCGVANLSSENVGVTITVKLCIYKTDDLGNEVVGADAKRIECGTYTYTFEAVSEANLANLK